MTKEQYEKLQPWLEENGLKLSQQQLGELEMQINNTRDENSVLLHIDMESIYFDASQRERVTKALLAVTLGQHDGGANALDEVIRSAAGYAIAAEENVMDELKKFANYTIDAAQQLGNIEGIKRGVGKSIVVPFTANEKVKS